jgi:hypothetical protein
LRRPWKNTRSTLVLFEKPNNCVQRRAACGTSAATDG